MGGLERVRRWAEGLGISPAESAALAVLVLGAAALLGLVWWSGRPDPAALAAADGLAIETERSAEGAAGNLGAGATPGAASESPGPAMPGPATPVVVHVAGEVAAPGVYRLAGGARVADALDAAGGATPAAVLDALNLARTLADGEQIVVPDAEAVEAGSAGGAVGAGGPAGGGTGGAAAGAGTAGGSAGVGVRGATAAGGAQRPDGTLDLNRATAAELEELPRIGPVLAERIVAHRDAVGGFGAVGDLRDVPGIGEKTLAGLAPLVSV